MSIDPVSLRLGELTAKIGSLADAQEAALQERRAHSVLLSGIVTDIELVKRDVAEMKRDVAEIKPSVTSFSEFRIKAIGAVAGLAMAAGLVGGAGFAAVKKALLG